MNVQEFKAWFDGFTELMDGPPSERAWKRILERVATIKDSPPVDRHQFYHHYVRPVFVPRYGGPSYGAGTTMNTHNAIGALESGVSFLDLGRAEGALLKDG